MKDDVTYVRSELEKYDPYLHDEIMKGYVQQWREGVDNEAVIFRKQNAGRRKANAWLRQTNHRRG